MKRKIVSLMTVAMTITGLLIGCGSSGTGSDAGKSEKAETNKESGVSKDNKSVDWYQESGDLSLYSYYSGNDAALLDEALILLKDMYPNVNITVEHRADSDGSALKSRATIGDLPDIMEVTGGATEALTKSGDIMPLDEVIEETGFKEKLIDGVLDGLQAADGKIYTVKASANTARIFYNTRVFKELKLSEPKNYKEFLNVIEVLKSNDIIPLALHQSEKWPGLQLYDVAIIGEGIPNGFASLEDGSKKITDPEFEKAAEKVVETVNKGLVGKGAYSTNATQASELVKTGKAGMFLFGDWFFREVLQNEDEIGYFEYNPFAETGVEEKKWNISGGQNSPGGYAVNTNGVNPELAKRVTLDLVLCKAKAAVIKFGDINYLKESLESEVEFTESYQKYSENLKNDKTHSKFGWSLTDLELSSALEEGTDKLYTGTYSAKDFIKDLENTISVKE